MPMLLLISLLRSSLVTSASNNSLRANGVDWDRDCIQPLSDVSPDGNITLTDYAKYVSELSDQRIQPNQALPLSITETFNHLACLKCENVFGDESDGRCCIYHDETGFIINLGDVKNPKTSKDNLYIFFVCSDTKARVDDLFAPFGTSSPELTSEPPSLSLSSQPTTLMPSTNNKIATEVSFMLENTAGLTAADLTNNVNGEMDGLLDAYDVTVKRVVTSMDELLIRRRMGERGRNLGEMTVLSTHITDVVDESCPAGSEENANCLNMLGHASIEVQGLDPPTAKKKVEEEILKAIESGLPGWPTERAIPITPGRAMSTEAIVGIASGAVILSVCALAALFTNHKRREHEKMEDDIESTFAASPRGSDVTSNLGASPAKYGKSSTRKTLVTDFSSLSGDEEDASNTLSSNEGVPKLSFSMEESLESSSNAGSSGWSSSAGMSSLNTVSVDSADQGYNLAMIGAASNIHNRFQNEDNSNNNKFYRDARFDPNLSDGNDSNDDSLSNKFSQMARLNTQIETKDWAAVGATAAILAQSESGSSNHSLSSDRFTVGSDSLTSNSIEQEFNRMVAVEDWNGIVIAASKIEAGEMSDRESDRSSKQGEDSASFRSANPSLGDTSGSYASASEGLTNNSSKSLISDSLSVGSYSGTPSVPSTGTGHGSESPGKIQRRAEIRTEVEELVRRVVPEEIDNVDEMMKQFRGREEELVETLRTMQERSIAQREREEMRRNAKREARKSVRKNGNVAVDSAVFRSALGARSEGLPPPVPSAAPTRGAVTGFAAMAHQKEAIHKDKNSVSSVSELSNVSSPMRKKDGITTKISPESLSHTPDFDNGSVSSKLSSPRRIDLERAIAVGDWDAVGEAAIKMGEGSISSATDLRSVDDSTTLESEEKASLNSGSKLSEINSTDFTQRASELEALIDRGDWNAVVAAAGRFSAADRQSSSKDGVSETDSSALQEKHTISDSLTSGTGSGSGWRLPFLGGSKRSLGSNLRTKKSGKNGSVSDRRKNRKTSKEEEDALAQAEIWMEIANQSKSNGAPDAKGASDAADWAISRSYTALRNAEQQSGNIASLKERDRPAAANLKSGSLSVGSSDCDKSV